MANTQGGTIILGVAEKSTGLVWEGVPDAAQLRTVLWGHPSSTVVSQLKRPTSMKSTG